MSGTVGEFTDTNHPDLLKAIHRIISTAKTAGVPVGGGVPLYTEQEIRQALSEGQQLVSVGADVPFLRSAVDSSLDLFKRCNVE